MTLLESSLIFGKLLHPGQEELEAEAYELHYAGQVRSFNRDRQRQERVQVEVELTPDELGALLGRGEAVEFAVEDVLDFLLDDDLLRLVKLEVTEGTLSLPCISTGVRAERTHFVRVFPQDDIVAL